MKVIFKLGLAAKLNKGEDLISLTDFMASESYYLLLADFEFMWWKSVITSGETTDFCPHLGRFWEVELFCVEI